MATTQVFQDWDSPHETISSMTRTSTRKTTTKTTTRREVRIKKSGKYGDIIGKVNGKFILWSVLLERRWKGGVVVVIGLWSGSAANLFKSRNKFGDW